MTPPPPGRTLLTVCTGAFVLGAAGLLDGRRCTAHWESVDELRARLPQAIIDPDVLFVDDGNLVTSAGTAAGIDAALHLVRRELGQRGRRRHRPPHGRAAAARRRPAPVRRAADPAVRARTASPRPGLGAGELSVEHSVADLARRARMSERSFARRFVAETGTTPHRWLTLQRVLLAQRMLEDTDLGVDDVARALRLRRGRAAAPPLPQGRRRRPGRLPPHLPRGPARQPAAATA